VDISFLSVVDTSVLVALSVYQMIVKNTLPVSSKTVPVFGQSAFTQNAKIYYNSYYYYCCCCCYYYYYHYYYSYRVSRVNV